MSYEEEFEMLSRVSDFVPVRQELFCVPIPTRAQEMQTYILKPIGSPPEPTVPLWVHGIWPDLHYPFSRVQTDALAHRIPVTEASHIPLFAMRNFDIMDATTGKLISHNVLRKTEFLARTKMEEIYLCGLPFPVFDKDVGEGSLMSINHDVNPLFFLWKSKERLRWCTSREREGWNSCRIETGLIRGGLVLIRPAVHSAP